MAIRIKRSSGDTAPALLESGQMAYVEGATNGGTLFYGEIGGTVREIAGKKFVDKLNGIAAGAEVNAVDSVAGKTGAVTLAAADVTDFTTAVEAVSINNLAEDTTPQLGGNLDVNGNNIVSTSNADININPHGTGLVNIKSGLLLGSGLVRGGGGLELSIQGVEVGGYTAIKLEDNRVNFGDVNNSARSFINTTNGSFNGNVVGNTDGTVTTAAIIGKTTNGNLTITPNGTGKIVLDGQSWPDADGVSGYVLKTNGSGVLAWSNINELTASPSSNDVTGALGFTPENAANKGVANGYASLDNSGLVPAAQLPSYVDDVLEFADLAAFPATGETGKIYVAIDTGKAYRWSGSVYIEISASPGTTDAVTEGATNQYYTDARVRAAVSATDAGGDGSLSYDSATGAFTYTGPSASDVRAHFSGGTGITVTDGVIATTITQYADSDARAALSASQNLSYDSQTGAFTGPDLTGFATSASLATVATSGDYEDLTNKPTLFTNVVEDTTPQLGGNLDVNGNNIVSISNGNINILPNGTGEVTIGGSLIKAGNSDNTGNTSIGTPAGNLRLAGQISPTGGSEIVLNGGVNGSININPNGTGGTTIQKGPLTLTSGSISANAGTVTASGFTSVRNSHTALSQIFVSQHHENADSNNFLMCRSRGTATAQTAVQSGDELAEFFISGNDGSAVNNAGMKTAHGYVTVMTDAPSTGLMPHRTDYIVNTTAGVTETYMSVANDRVLRVAELGAVAGVTNLNISAGTDGNIALAPNGTGRVVLDGLSYPAADGTNGQVIKTDGAGNLSFVTPSAGVTTFAALTDTPADFSGAGSYYVKVNSGATALEFSQDVDDGTF